MVKGIFSGLVPRRKRAAEEAAREEHLDTAYALHMELRSDREVAEALAAAGAPAADIPAINAEARAVAEQQIAARVRLPESAALELNYYFLLGVTPNATAARIRSAYRRKAKDVHPDTHARDLASGQWERFMVVLTEAHEVLSDPMKRRAYDIFWRQRSRELAAYYRRPGERRGDWETRYLWEIAEMGEREDAMAPLVEQLAQMEPGTAARPAALQQLRQAAVNYEAALVEVRTDTRALPERLRHFSSRAVTELQRKERLVAALHELLGAARQEAGSTRETTASKAAVDILREIRQAQHGFDLLHARSHI